MLDALVKLIHTKEAKGEIINIGSNEERKVIILAEIILKHLGINKSLLVKTTPLGSANRRMPDISKLKNLQDGNPKLIYSMG